MERAPFPAPWWWYILLTSCDVITRMYFGRRDPRNGKHFTKFTQILSTDTFGWFKIVMPKRLFARDWNRFLSPSSPLGNIDTDRTILHPNPQRQNGCITIDFQSFPRAPFGTFFNLVSIVVDLISVWVSWSELKIASCGRRVTNFPFA